MAVSSPRASASCLLEALLDTSYVWLQSAIAIVFDVCSFLPCPRLDIMCLRGHLLSSSLDLPDATREVQEHYCSDSNRAGEVSSLCYQAQCTAFGSGHSARPELDPNQSIASTKLVTSLKSLQRILSGLVQLFVPFWACRISSIERGVCAPEYQLNLGKRHQTGSRLSWIQIKPA